MSVSMTLSQEARQHVAQTLAQLLADSNVLLMKTKNFHWNLVDGRFHFLHLFFEEQYTALEEAVDVIAERIRMLEIKTPATMRRYLEMTLLEEAGTDVDGNEMIRQLLDDHEAIANHIRPKISESQKLGDEGSADLLIERLRYHEKQAWMLRSHLANEGG